MKKTFSLLFILILVLAFCLPLFTAQAALVPCGRAGTDECTECHFFLMIQNIYNFIVKIAAPLLAGLFIAIGGLMYILSLTTGSSESKVAAGKKILTSVVIGLVIIYTSWLVINLIFGIFLNEEALTGFKRVNWYQFQCEVK